MTASIVFFSALGCEGRLGAFFLAAAISAQRQQPVRWQACGRNGVTVADAQSQLLPLVPAGQVDLHPHHRPTAQRSRSSTSTATDRASRIRLRVRATVGSELRAT